VTGQGKQPAWLVEEAKYDATGNPVMRNVDDVSKRTPSVRYHIFMSGGRRVLRSENVILEIFKRFLKLPYSKRTGLDKAVYRIEQALERSQANGGRLEDEQAALHLQQLLSKTQNLLPRQSISSDLMPGIQAQSASPHSQGHISNYSREHVNSSLADTATSGQVVADDGYALEDAENPLQLLARASDLPVSPSHLLPAPDQPAPAAITSHPEHTRASNENQDLQKFFGPLTPHLDVGEDIDPIDMGFVTSNETDVLFSL
jgi:hypothetical protein